MPGQHHMYEKDVVSVLYLFRFSVIGSLYSFNARINTCCNATFTQHVDQRQWRNAIPTTVSDALGTLTVASVMVPQEYLVAAGWRCTGANTNPLDPALGQNPLQSTHAAEHIWLNCQHWID